MDIVWMLAGAGFFLASYGLVAFLDTLRGEE